eukprot:TRINITY_DN4106_c0_g1_i5.p1 TRINITY_DN4106_c0_g1~~TRINITY_DN4106_c0_g1_i5.p1  ORF type:complete len:271 (+),score=49.80 TRINITY_DN4106_c0_g1_i5:61-813(+)
MTATSLRTATGVTSGHVSTGTLTVATIQLSGGFAPPSVNTGALTASAIAATSLQVDIVSSLSLSTGALTACAIAATSLSSSGAITASSVSTAGIVTASALRSVNGVTFSPPLGRFVIWNCAGRSLTTVVPFQPAFVLSNQGVIYQWAGRGPALCDSGHCQSSLFSVDNNVDTEFAGLYTTVFTISADSDAVILMTWAGYELQTSNTAFTTVIAGANWGHVRALVRYRAAEGWTIEGMTVQVGPAAPLSCV